MEFKFFRIVLGLFAKLSVSLSSQLHRRTQVSLLLQVRKIFVRVNWNNSKDELAFEFDLIQSAHDLPKTKSSVF